MYIRFGLAEYIPSTVPEEPDDWLRGEPWLSDRMPFPKSPLQHENEPLAMQSEEEVMAVEVEKVKADLVEIFLHVE